MTQDQRWGRMEREELSRMLASTGRVAVTDKTPGRSALEIQ
ncbi:MAG: hypothetical protein ACT4OO_13445 [Nitrospiraceae bacterium]